MKLDPAADQEADARLHELHPELQGRRLTSRKEDARYRLEKARLYREALERQPKAITSKHPLHDRMMAKCDQSGITSPCCGKAQKDPKVKDIVKRTKDMRTLAANTHMYPGAVWALDHFLEGTGKFAEIPQLKVDAVRYDSEAIHVRELLGLLKSPNGAKTMLALQLVDKNDNIKNDKDWPDNVSFTMDYLSGKPTHGASDDNLAYNDSTIRSDVEMQCTRLGNDRSYLCHIVSWRCYVVDNYDWEGGGSFSFGDKFSLPVSQDDMNLLHQVGCAKSYQRSSKSWQRHDRIEPWVVGFSDDNDLYAAVDYRRSKISDRVEQEKQEAKDGALPTPPPAEKVPHDIIARECLYVYPEF